MIANIGPLRPNTPYKFRFITLTRNNLPELKIRFLRQEVDRELTKLFQDPRAVNIQEISAVNDNLIKISTEVIADDKLVDGNSEPFSIANYKKDLNLFSYRFLVSHQEQSDNLGKLDQLFSSEGNSGLFNNISAVLPRLSEINSGVIRLSNYARQAVALTIKSNSDQSRSVPQQLAFLQTQLTNLPALKQQALEEAMTSDTTGDTRTGSIEEVVDLLNVLRKDEFTKQDNSRVFTASEVSAIGGIIESLNQIAAFQKGIAAAGQSLQQLKTEMAQVLVNAFVNESYVLSSVAEFDAESKTGPYVGLDLGLMVAFNPYKNQDGPIGNNTYIGVQEGINIYFSPVNKRVPLNSFRWPYRFYKSLHLHVGLAQVLGGFDTYRYENSLGFVGNFVTGVGFRLNRVTNIGLNAMFVNLRNINPTVSQSRLKPLFGLSVSCDINVARPFAMRREP
ncbi:hypothetical protein [Larkinella soli]|uniref:hypothetical protein n=1 Tax=Larkinella soli TaxID=1770527 RepID=UPI000FFBFF33|nr:hypothetical protein [Larkinella soli]